MFSAVKADTDVTHASLFVRTRVLPLVPSDELRLPGPQLAEAVTKFCVGVSEFWAWQPTVKDLQGYDLSPTEAADAHRRYADWDLQLLRELTGAAGPAWHYCHDLQRLATANSIMLPINAQPHHPGRDAAWGRSVYLAADASEPAG